MVDRHTEADGVRDMQNRAIAGRPSGGRATRSGGDHPQVANRIFETQRPHRVYEAWHGSHSRHRVRSMDDACIAPELSEFAPPPLKRFCILIAARQRSLGYRSQLLCQSCASLQRVLDVPEEVSVCAATAQTFLQLDRGKKPCGVWDTSHSFCVNHAHLYSTC